MKKQMTLLAAVVLLVTFLTPAVAATPITGTGLPEKLNLQVQSSGLDVFVTFSADGDDFLNTDPALWQLMKTLLPSLKLHASSTVKTNSPQRESLLQIEKEGAVAGEMQLLFDGHRYALKSDLISEIPQYFVFDKNFDLSLLSQAAAKKTWPDVRHLLFNLYSADENQREKTDELISPYLADLGMWMQNYLAVTMETENGKNITRQYGEFPAADVKSKMQEMLTALYQDTDLLNHLKTLLSPSQQAAYLNPVMLTAFQDILKNAPLEGTVIIDRKYDETGLSLLDSIELPMANGKIKNLKIAITPEKGLKAYTFSGLTADGRSFEITLNPENAVAYRGRVRMDVINEETKEKSLRSFVFEMMVKNPDETYDLKEDLCEKKFELALMVIVQDDDTAGTHDFTLHTEGKLTSKSAKRASTHLDGVLTLTDDMTGGTVTVTVNGKTATPWQPMLMEDMEESTVLSPEEMLPAVQKWMTRFGEWLGDLMKLSVNP